MHDTPLVTILQTIVAKRKNRIKRKKKKKNICQRGWQGGGLGMAGRKLRTLVAGDVYGCTW